MIHGIFAASSVLAICMALAGLLFGLLYFAALKRSVTLIVGGKRWLDPLALTMGRIGAAGGFLFVAAQLGAEPLLAVFAGFLMARPLTLRLERKAG